MRKLKHLTLSVLVFIGIGQTKAEEVSPDLIKYVNFNLTNLTNLNGLINNRFPYYRYSTSEGRELYEKIGRSKSNFFSIVLDNKRLIKLKADAKKHLSCIPKENESTEKASYNSIALIIIGAVQQSHISIFQGQLEY